MNLEAMLKNGWWANSPFFDRNMLVVPAHPSNYYSGLYGKELRVCQPIAYVWHEPQEPADGYESTPVYFSGPDRDASTTYYGDNDGDTYQCVPLNRAPIANGLKGMPVPRFNDGGPEFGAYSLNQQTHSDEEEGYTHNIHITMTNAQHGACVDRAALFLIMYDLPRNPKRVGLAHGHIATDRSDGIWIAEKSGIPQEATDKVLKMEKDIQELKQLAWDNAQRDNVQDKNIWSQALRLNDLEKHTAHPPK